MVGRFRYWRHVRSGEVVAVVVDDDGAVTACSLPLPLDEAMRQLRRDVLPWEDRCRTINEHRGDFRPIPPTQLDILRMKYGVEM